MVGDVSFKLDAENQQWTLANELTVHARSSAFGDKKVSSQTKLDVGHWKSARQVEIAHGNAIKMSLKSVIVGNIDALVTKIDEAYLSCRRLL
jgi:hypothetical protein